MSQGNERSHSGRDSNPGQVGRAYIAAIRSYGPRPTLKFFLEVGIFGPVVPSENHDGMLHVVRSTIVMDRIQGSNEWRSIFGT